MNNVYIYDSSQIHVYETEDLGSITDVATTVVDHGVKMFDYIVQDGTPGVIHDTLIVPVGQDYIVNEVTGSIDYEDVWITETTYPVSGNINFSGGEENSAAVVFVATAEPIVLRERAIVVTKQAWTGSGSLFEIGSGLERMVAPYIGGSGTLRISGAADSSETNSYNLDSIIAYGSDADYGLVIAAVGSSHDYGQVTGIVTEGETDNGTVVDLGGSNPFGLFTFAGRSDTPNITKGYSGSGSLRLRGSVDEALDEPFNQIYIVGRNIATGQFVRRDVIGLRFHGGNPEAFARVGYQGSGSLFGFSGGEEAKVYDYTTESAVTLSTPQDYGDILTSAINNENYGQVAGIVTEGEFDNGSIVIGGYTKATEGSFSFSGISQSVRNRHHIGSGSISIAKHIDSYGEGQSSDIAFLPHYRSRGGITIANHVIPDAFARTHVGSGSLFEIGQKDERATFTYGIGSVAVSVTVPEIVLAPWNGTSAYTGSNISAVASGNGIGQSGGFNSSTTTYWRFTGQGSSNTYGSNPRILTLGQLDLTNYNEFEFTAIAGTSSNGGENCDTDEDLEISYSTDGGTTYTQITVLDAEDARFTGSTFGLVTLDIPEAAKTSGVILKFCQEKHSGSAYDQWGIEYVKLLESTTVSSGPGQVYDTIDSVDQGTVDHGTGITEDYGTVTTPFTNGIVDYGQLNPGLFKFGDIKISGGDSAHANPRSYRGAIERVTESVIPPITILPDDLVNVSSYNTVFDDVNVRNAGTGTGSAGGFNIGRHLAFEGGSTTNNVRSITFEIDTREFDQIAITVIRGNDSNGGNAPESNEDLKLFYSPDPAYNNGNFLQYGNILAYNSADGVTAPVRKVFNISGSFYNNPNQRFRIVQGNADSTADNYAITQIEFLSTAGLTPVTPFDIQPTSFSLGGSADIQIQEPPTQIYRYGLTQNQTSKGEFFKIGGGMSDIKVVKGSWVGSGALFNSGALIERTTFDYNDFSIATVETPIDNGQITSSGSAADYGQITEYGLGETDFGQVGILQTTQPFGKLYELSGGDIAHSNPVAYLGSTARISITGGYSNLKFVSQAGESTALFEIRNAPGGEGNTYANVKPFIGSGSLFHIGDRLESKTYSYTTASIAPTDQQYDNGSVTSASTTNEDYGLITNLFDPGLAEDYGDVSNIIGDENPFGLYHIYGSADEQYFPTFNWNRQSPPIRIFNDQQDPADFRFRPHWRTDTTTTNPPRISNGPGGEFHTYAQVRPFIGSGRLFGLGDKFESATFRYTTESIVVIETPVDHGGLDNPDPVTLSAAELTNLQYTTDGDVVLSQTGNGSGSGGGFAIGEHLRFASGSGSRWFTFTYDTALYNQIEITGIKGNGSNGGEEPDSGEDLILQYLDGGGSWVTIDTIIAENDTSFNTLKTAVIALPQAAQSNNQAFRLYQEGASGSQYDHYGISSIKFLVYIGGGFLTEDYGQIADIVSGGEVDNGQVGITQTTESATGLYKFSGNGVPQFLRGPYVVKDGLIKIYKGKSAPTDFRFMPHWRSRPYEQGKLTGIAETPRARDFVGAGRLFGLGDKFESATFRYTTESIVVVEQPEDYGLITSNATQNLDFGDVSSAITPDGEVDFGQVVITQTTQSATGLYKFSGESKDQFFRGPYVAKEGFIRFYKGQSADTDFRFMPHWRGVPDEQFKVSGSAETPRGRDFVGTGSLFNIGDKIEKKVYNYTTESIEVVQPSDDWGSITTSGGTLDYGDVGSAVTPGGEFDFGQVVITQTTQSATGLFRFSGEGAEVKSSTPPAERFEISISGSAIERVTSGDDENTILFNFTGSLTESFSKGLYNGSGSLFEIGQKDERVVFHYNTSSIGDSFGSDDRGSITTTPITNVDNGLIADETVPPTIDYGFNIDVPGSERPLGQLFEITGADSGHKQTFSEFSSGSLFGASGAAEAAVWQTPEETFLLKMRGGAVEKHVENWVGSGLIKYPEDTPLAPNAAVRFRPHWRGAPDHSPKILGTADAAFKGAYVSKGVFSRMYTHDKGEEWLRYRPSPRYVNSIYGKIGGSAFVNGDGGTRKISVFGYYGDDRDPGTSGSLFGIGGAAESRGITPPLEDTVIFTLNGTAASKFNPHWRGRPDGSPRLSGTPELQLLFNIFTNPEGERFNVYGDAVPVRTIKYDGSGTLFTAGSSAEVVGFNPDIETRAFKFSGEPIVRIRVILFGGGSMFGFGSGAESTTIAVPESTVLFVPSGAAVPVITLNYDGSGTEVISGTATEKRTASHVGDGSLFGTGGAAEAVAVSEAESTALFIPSGGDQNSFTRIKQGSGSATINGNAVPVITLNFSGSGSLFSLGGSSEVTTVSEESTGLFEFNGTAEPVIRTRGFAGSGSLFSIGGGEEVAAVAEESTGLFTISGDAEAPFTRTKVGSGTTFISGVKEESFSKGNYDGEGSFSAFGGAAEIVGFDPAEETFLYEFTGNATATRTRGFAGSGTATVLNETVIPVITLNYFGDGSLTTFGGAAESRTVDVENTTLFEFRNGATESFTKGNYDAEGSATVSGEASDIKLTFGNEVFAYVSASGNADESKTDDYVGSGSLFSVVSTTIARTIDYDETSVGAQGEVVSTSLFRISGENPGSVTRITQPTTAEFRTQGEAISKVILFSPPRTYSTII